METIVAAENVDFYYGKFQALKRVSFSVTERESVALIGPNGAGKTTLIRCLMGIFKVDAGEIKVFGTNPYAERSRIMNEIGYLPENAGVYPMKLKNYLLFFARLRGVPEPEERVRAVSEVFGLESVLNKRLDKFSLGMQQRAKLASLMLHNPRLFVLDEPDLGLDISAKEDLIGLLIELRKLGRTLIISSHEPYMLDRLCQRMVLLIEGEVAFDGLFDLERWISLVRQNALGQRISSLLSESKRDSKTD